MPRNPRRELDARRRAAHPAAAHTAPNRAVETLAGLSGRHACGILPNDFLGLIPDGGQRRQVSRANRADACIRLEQVCTGGETMRVEIGGGSLYRVRYLAD